MKSHTHTHTHTHTHIYIYIYIYIYFLWRYDPSWAMFSSFFRFVDHNDAPQSLGLLWTRDKLVTETSI
jgi:hypothetical protein